MRIPLAPPPALAMFGKNMKRTVHILILSWIALTSVGCVSPGNEESEWLPSISEPVHLEHAVLRLVPVPGITNAPAVWIRHLDLDSDGKEDSVVTSRIPDELGPYWINRRSVTYVFRGGEAGAFGSYAKAEPWFFVVTYEALFHVRYGDKETRRLFSVSKEAGQWVVTVKQYEYGNDGGEARDRLMSLRKITTSAVPIKKLLTKGMPFVGTFNPER